MSLRSRIASLLSTLALDTRENVSWALYDWANSAFVTTVVAAVLPIYYAEVAGGNSTLWGYTTALSLFLIAVMSPALGAVADYMGAKKRFMGFFVTLGVVFTSFLFFVREGDWLMASVIFIVANIGFAGANVFYDSLLPHVVSSNSDETDSRNTDVIDRLSAAGYALGYLGGGVLLLINIVWILSPETFGLPNTASASRWAMLSVAVWWAVFSIPLFRNVSEPERRMVEGEKLGMNPLRAGYGRLKNTFDEVSQYRELLIFLVAFWLYSDGIGTIIKMATIYGTEIGLDTTGLIGALILTQFVGIPFAFVFGRLPGTEVGFRNRSFEITTKRGLYAGLTVYTAISVGGYFMTETWHFWILAFLVATVQGGTQALSRSLYGSMVPRSESSEFFGFYSVSSKFAGIFGPAIFASVRLATGSSRFSILSLVFLFLGGIYFLSRVDVEKGREVARRAEERDEKVDTS